MTSSDELRMVAAECRRIFNACFGGKAGERWKADSEARTELQRWAQLFDRAAERIEHLESQWNNTHREADELAEQLSAMTKARDEACDIAKGAMERTFMESWSVRETRLQRIAELRRVGGDK